MTVDLVLDVLTGVLLVTGSLLALLASIGLLRLPDVPSRMHAATKPQILGVLLVLAGAAIQLRTTVDVWMLVLAGAFQLVTVPVAAHLVGRLSYRTQHTRRDILVVDELEQEHPSEVTWRGER